MDTQRPYCLSTSIQWMPPTSLGSFSTGVFYASRGGSETVRCGYGTRRIPVKDKASITHSPLFAHI